MIEVSGSYKALADADARNIEIKIEVGDTTFSADSIISLKIYRSIGSGGFAIGNATSDFCRFSLAAPTRGIRSNAKVIPYVRFLSSNGGGGEWFQLGVFYVTSAAAGRKELVVTAYDMMYMLDKRCTYLGTSGGSVPPLPFPCSMQQLLQYTCDIKGLECDFQCADFTVDTRPVVDLNLSGDKRYYTHRQMLGYIAGAHGANACFDNEGKLVFRQIVKDEAEDGKYIEALDCIEQNVDSEEPFTVLGLLLQVGETNIFINDTEEPYDEDMAGIVVHSNPLGSIAVAEYIWNKLGNFSYCSCDFTRRGRGWIETGDLLNINDNTLVWGESEEGEDGEESELQISSKNVNILVQSIELEFSASTGFIEHITSEAETAAESSNHISSGGGSSGVGKWTNPPINNSEIFNDYSGNTAEGNFVHTAGYNNKNSGDYSSISGGHQHSITGPSNGILSGRHNIIKGSSNAITGGENHEIDGSMNFIGSGMNGSISGSFSGIVAGQNNSIASSQSFVGAGFYNSIDGATHSAILAGQYNKINSSAIFSVILGGQSNEAAAPDSLAHGVGLKTDRYCQAVFGTYNAPTNEQGIFVVGGGGSETSRRNLAMLDYKGNLQIAGKLFVNGAPITGDSGGDGSGGTYNYNELDNRPQIEGVTLEGDVTFEQLGLFSYVENGANKTVITAVISEKSTENEAASAKAVYDYVTSMLDGVSGGGNGGSGSGDDSGGSSTGGGIDYDALDKRYAAKQHSHSEYALTTHTHSEYLTEDKAKVLIDEEIDSKIGSGSNTGTGGGTTAQAHTTLYSTGQDVNIGSTSAEAVRLGFSAAAACVPMLTVTVQFSVSTAGTVDFSVTLDGSTMNTFSETCTEGKHFRTVSLPVLGVEGGDHVITVSVNSEDEAGEVDGANTCAVLSGQGLSAYDGEDVDPDEPDVPDTERTHSGEIYVEDPAVKYSVTLHDVSKAAISAKIEPIELDTPKITLI